jgi:hypothetical protein
MYIYGYPDENERAQSNHVSSLMVQLSLIEIKGRVSRDVAQTVKTDSLVGTNE